MDFISFIRLVIINIWFFITYLIIHFFIILPITSFKFNKVSVIRCWSQPYVSTEKLYWYFWVGAGQGELSWSPWVSITYLNLSSFRGLFFVPEGIYNTHSPSPQPSSMLQLNFGQQIKSKQIQNEEKVLHMI